MHFGSSNMPYFLSKEIMLITFVTITHLVNVFTSFGSQLKSQGPIL
jgi:hypothetical protein